LGALQQPAAVATAAAAGTSTHKHKIKLLLLDGIHPTAIAVIQAALAADCWHVDRQPELLGSSVPGVVTADAADQRFAAAQIEERP